MATKIVTKNSSTASAVPTASDLVQGELAVNVADKRLFTEDNAGAIVELGTNPSTLTVTGEITANGGIALGDNDKATFGAGDDLQIYHNGGSGNYIDSVNKDLYIRCNLDAGIAGGDILLQPKSGENSAIFKDNGAVDLYYDNVAKFSTTATGIDVTGTATMDGLSISNASGGNVAQFTNVSSADLNINLTSGVTLLTPSTGILAFGTVTTERMRIDSSGNVGIGTSSPSSQLHISSTGATTATIEAGGGGDAVLDIKAAEASGGESIIRFSDSVSGVGFITYAQNDGGSDYMRFGTASTERLRIDASGNLTTRQSTGNNFRIIRFGDNSVEVGNYNATDGYQNTSYLSSTHTFYAGTAGAESVSRAVDIDSSGRVGIGTSAPLTGIDLRGTSASAGNTIQIVGNAVSTLLLGQDADGGVIRGQGGNNALKFYTGGTGDSAANASGTERMRITSGGSLYLGAGFTTWQSNSFAVEGISSGAYTVTSHINGAPSGQPYSYFFYNNGVIGSITQNGTTGVAYNTSSDYRLKENVVPMTGSIDRVKALKPSRFNFIADADTTVDGFLAHEAQAVVPECVTGTKDAMKDEEYEVTAAIEEVRDEDGNITTEAVEAVMGTRSVPDMQGIDQSKLVPLLTAALQEAITKIESLTARVAALEA